MSAKRKQGKKITRFDRERAKIFLQETGDKPTLESVLYFVAQVRTDALAAGFKRGWEASEAFEDFDQAFQKCCALTTDSPASSGKGGGEAT
jgi:hypothetical protein